MSELERLVERCKGEVTVEFNPHRNDYQSLQEWLDQPAMGPDETRGSAYDVEPEDLAEMIARDRIVVLRFYPDTPIGFFVMAGPDLGPLLMRAHLALNDKVKS